MSFSSGQVSFCRFNVEGDSPKSVTEDLLSRLTEHAFVESSVGSPEQIEVGFTSTGHMLDTEFSHQANAFGVSSNRLLIGLRIDTHKPPAELKRAYRMLNTQAAAAESPTGYASRNEKRDAAEEADRMLHGDLVAGRFRKSRTAPVLWDLATKQVYLGTTTTTAVEQLSSLMTQAFDVKLHAITAGALVGTQLLGRGRTRDYEDLTPSPFTAPPPEARDAADDAEGSQRGPVTVPQLPWLARSVDLKDFLGNELLIWLWYLTETHEGRIDMADGASDSEPIYIAIDQTLDMDCAWGVRGKQTLRGDGPTRLPEAGDALEHGKWPRKVGLILARGDDQWQLTLGGETLNVNGAKLPTIEDVEDDRELLDERLERIVTLAEAIDDLVWTFASQRVGSSWASGRKAISAWIANR